MGQRLMTLSLRPFRVIKTLLIPSSDPDTSINRGNSSLQLDDFSSPSSFCSTTNLTGYLSWMRLLLERLYNVALFSSGMRKCIGRSTGIEENLKSTDGYPSQLIHDISKA
ncbi:hypothetical protein HZH66_004918 [Vespula vulgaris]|uniref:Uncharacterized protein n=1 Tax=Vespula vulgaris TaxID=7454 RepID=A0A834K9J6_VESVU|nr:hypothetical protein HZH66_004918 [Vespula vulgaris]